MFGNYVDKVACRVKGKTKQNIIFQKVDGSGTGALGDPRVLNREQVRSTHTHTHDLSFGSAVPAEERQEAISWWW